jgi:hypothetical protein
VELDLAAQIIAMLAAIWGVYLARLAVFKKPSKTSNTCQTSKKNRSLLRPVASPKKSSINTKRVHVAIFATACGNISVLKKIYELSMVNLLDKKDRHSLKEGAGSPCTRVSKKVFQYAWYAESTMCETGYGFFKKPIEVANCY